MKRVIILLLISILYSQGRFDGLEIKVHAVNKTVYYLVGAGGFAGGNIGLSVGDDGVFMIDDQFAALTEKIELAIKTISDKPIRFLINTHLHGDHTGGNENFGKKGVSIVAHDLVRRKLSKKEFDKIKSSNAETPKMPGLPVITFHESIKFYLNSDEIEIFHVPNAHTDGDAIIYFKEANVFHMGDTFFQNSYPYIDLNNGGSIYGIIKASEEVIKRANDQSKIIPGHGSIANKKDIMAYRDMLKDLSKKIIDLKKSGLTLAEVIAKRPSAKYDSQYNSAYNLTKNESFIKYVYRSKMH